MDTTRRDTFWNTSTTKRPPSSGGMGSRFMMPSDTEIMAVKLKMPMSPMSTASFDMTAMPMMEVVFDTVSAAVAGLNRLATRAMTWPM